MNRREFLGSCIAAGTAMGLGACVGSNGGLTLEDKNLLDGLQIADPHAHPYQFHGNTKYDATMPDMELINRMGMKVCSFSAVGDMVKYRGRSGSAYSDTMNQLQTVTRLQKEGKVRLILNRSDLKAATQTQSLPGALMAIEGGDALEGSFENLDRFYQSGVRLITLMHYHENEIGFYQTVAPDGPLKPFGVKLVEKMNQSGILIDVAHSKTNTLKSIADITRAPLIDSHTNPLPYGFEPAQPLRMRTWPEMERVVKTGGVVCTWPKGYSRNYQKRETFKDWAEEIVLMKSRLGIEHCGLGTDSGGHLPRTVRGWESYASLPDLILAMKEAGLSQTDIAAYLGGNFLRLLDQCLG
jgi:membrane dipeptidase